MHHRNDQQSHLNDGTTSSVIRWLLLLMLTVVGILTPAGPARANAEDFASYWKLTFDFNGSSFNGNLHIDMGKNDGTGGVAAPALLSRDFPVACQRVGSVSLAGGSAIFNGGYLQCELDVKRAIAEVMLACQQIEPSCEIAVDDQHIYPHLHMAASVYSTATGIAPLFYHPDARYAAIVSGTGLGDASLKARLTKMGTIESTLAAPPALNHWLTYQAAYDCNACEMNFGISGVTQTVPVGPDMQVSFYTPQSTIYIGYDPDSGNVIPSNTAIDFLSIDPPNMGNGG